MHNATVHHLLTDAQPDPEQQPLPPASQLPPFIALRDAAQWGTFGQFGSAVLAVPSQLLLHPRPSCCHDSVRS